MGTVAPTVTAGLQGGERRRGPLLRSGSEERLAVTPNQIGEPGGERGVGITVIKTSLSTMLSVRSRLPDIPTEMFRDEADEGTARAGGSRRARPDKADVYNHWPERGTQGKLQAEEGGLQPSLLSDKREAREESQ